MAQNREYRIKKTHIYGYLIFENDTKHTQWGKDNFFRNYVGKTGLSTYKRMKLDS